MLSVTDHNTLVEKMKGFDVVVNATAAKFSIGILEAAMDAGVNVVDLGGGSLVGGETHRARSGGG